jgi:glyoxylase-like metal-dependent hydrolase (beta-lactamase superfamily II)
VPPDASPTASPQLRSAVTDADLVLSRHVAVLTGASNGKYPDGNSTVVTGLDGTVLIDPSLTVHARGGVPGVDRVLISHAHEDHVAGLSVLDAAHIHAHHDDVHGVRSVDGLLSIYGLPEEEAQRFRVDLIETFHIGDVPAATGFADGDVFDLGGVSVRVVHLPGHTRGHSAFVVEPDGVAFVGDVDLSSFGPYYGDHWSDLDDFVASIAKVRDVEADQFVTFHHKGVISGRDEFLRQLDAFGSIIDRRDERLLTMVARPRSFDDLVEEGLIYRPGTRPSAFGEAVERRSIQMHLDRLRRAGAVAVLDDGSYEAA